MDGDYVWATSGPHAIQYQRGKVVRYIFIIANQDTDPILSEQVNRLTSPLTKRLANVAIFGDRLLVLTDDGSRLYVWNMSTMGMLNDCSRSKCFDKFVSLDLVGTIEFERGFTASLILHPATYLNKILVTSNEGSMQLWNIRTM